MSLADHVTWFKLGRPRLGDVTVHKKNTYTFEEGAEVAKRLEAAFGPLNRVVAADLGCGPGESAIAKQILAIPWKRLVSVEAFIPYLNKLQEKNVAAERHDVFNGRIQDAFREYRPRELEVGMMIDVLEHFPRGEALGLLEKAEKVFSRGFVIFVPLGQVEQDAYDQNALQRHRSSWEAADLARLGYKVTVYEGFHGHLNPPASAAWAIKRWG